MRVMRRAFSVTFVCLLSFIFMMFFSGTVKANAYATVEAEIPVNCLKVSNNQYVYEIKIESENEYAPVPDSDILKIEENGIGIFKINLTEPGTFSYQIREIAGDDQNIKYDSSVYVITVFVTNDTDGGLAYSISAQIDGQKHKPEGIKFKDAVLSETETVPTDMSQITESVATTTTVTNSSASSFTDSAASSETVVTTATTESATVSTTKSATESTTKSTTVTTATDKKTENTSKNVITDIMESVLTGDTFPAHTVRFAMIACVITGIFTAFLKRDDDEEEDENK